MMKMKIKVDATDFNKSLRRLTLTEQDMLDIEGSGAKQIVNVQRMLVPVDTAATKASVNSHIESSSDERVVDNIGPETDYGLWLEYGTGEFAEGGKGRKGGWVYKDANGFHFTFGMQPRPFVRPSVIGNEGNIERAITATFMIVVKRKWQTA
jgi:hypothetical protein